MGSTRNRRASRQAAGFTTTTTTTASRVTGRSSAGARPATARSAGAPLDTPPDAPLDTPHDAPNRDTRKREAPEGAPRASLYDDVTNRIVAELEAGRFPWVQPWAQPCGLAASGGPAPGLPRNARTGRRYSGVNILILWGAVIAHGYPGQGWLTFRQALDAGGSVRKGERGTCVVYADRFTPEAERARALEQGEDARAIPFLKLWRTGKSERSSYGSGSSSRTDDRFNSTMCQQPIRRVMQGSPTKSTSIPGRS